MIDKIRNRNIIFWTLLALYTLAITEKLTAFPLYFFCDEAIVGVEARSILQTGYDTRNAFLPLFFHGFGNYCLGLTIYIQSLFQVFLKLSEFSIRLQTSLISVLGAVAIYKILKNHFDSKIAFLSFPILYASPLWFLFSRTGFGVSEATTFYLISIYFYLNLINEKGNKTDSILYSLFASACFYSYVAARGWIISAALLLFLFNYKLQIKFLKKTIISYSFLILLIVIPYGIFSFKNPEIALKRASELGLFEKLNSNPYETVIFWLQNITKLLNPSFWFFWNNEQAIGAGQRNVIPELSAVPSWLFPFFIIGIIKLLFNIRSVNFRTLLLVLVTSTFPGFLAEASFLRCMPTGILTLVISLIGLDQVLIRLVKFKIIKPIIFTTILCYSVFFRYHVFNVAPNNYASYEFFGLQSGASDVFNWIKSNSNNYKKFMVSSALFNQSDIFLPFYLEKDLQEKTKIFEPSEICQYANDPNMKNYLFIISDSHWKSLPRNSCREKVFIVDQLFSKINQPLFIIFTQNLND